MHKKINVLVLMLLSTTLLVGFFVSDKVDYSAKENRYLQTWPSFDLENVANGDYFSQAASYFSDHFVLRDYWISIYSAYNKCTLKDEVNDVYFGKDNYLIEKYTTIERKDLIYKSINNFVDNNPSVEVEVMLVPTSVCINEDKLPKYALNGNQREDWQIITDNLNCQIIDVYAALKDCSQAFYYSDHHWTSQGAYAAYKVFCQSNDLEVKEYTSEIVSTNFLGTIASKTNLFNQKYDVIERYVCADEYTVSFSETISNSLYFDECLETVDQYAYFFNGNHPIVSIVNNKATNDEKILIIKDSYANCFVPYLISYYQEIVMIDPRYYSLSIHDYLQANNINKVLFLYNMNTIGEDSGIRGIE